MTTFPVKSALATKFSDVHKLDIRDETLSFDSGVVDQQTYWDQEAQNYDSLYSDSWSAAENAFVVDTLGAFHGKTPRVLDLGCGTGLGYELCRKVYQDVSYVGLDISPRMIDELQRKYPDVDVIHGSMEDLSALPPASFDAVTSFFGSASHARSLLKVMNNVHRVLKPGGHFRISVYSNNSLRRWVRRERFTSERYTTRHSSRTTETWVHTYRMQEIDALARETQFGIVRVDGFAAFATLAEKKRMWWLDRLLCDIRPSLGHTLDVTLERLPDIPFGPSEAGGTSD